MANRTITYVEAINETFHQMMEEDESIIIIGACCVSSPWYVGGTLNGIKDKFPDRIIDGPVSENAITGAAIGMALNGFKPVMVYPRHDFALYAMDPIINTAAKIHYMFGGALNVPIVFYMIINRGGSQGCQHSQDFTWLFKQIPGLKVARPSNPWEGKGMLTWAINEPNPVVFVDNRELYHLKDDVERESFEINPMQYHNKKGDELPFCPVPCAHNLEEKYFRRGK